MDIFIGIIISILSWIAIILGIQAIFTSNSPSSDSQKRNFGWRHFSIPKYTPPEPLFKTTTWSEWQSCPHCKGNGYKENPFSGLELPTCDVCNGKKIINSEGKPPKDEETI